MKKFVAFLLSICMVILCGCNSAGNETTEATTTAGTNETTETTVAILTPTEIYDVFLNKLVTKLRNIIVDDTHMDGFSTQEGMSGVAENVVTGDTKLLEKFGYTILDINGDGFEELLICLVDELADGVCNGTKILCAYTASENEAVLVFEGTSENAYYYLGDAMFYNEVAGGNHNVCTLDAATGVLIPESVQGDEATRIQKIDLSSFTAFNG